MERTGKKNGISIVYKVLMWVGTLVPTFLLVLLVYAFSSQQDYARFFFSGQGLVVPAESGFGHIPDISWVLMIAVSGLFSFYFSFVRIPPSGLLELVSNLAKYVKVMYFSLTIFAGFSFVLMLVLVIASNLVSPYGLPEFFLFGKPVYSPGLRQLGDFSFYLLIPICVFTLLVTGRIAPAIYKGNIFNWAFFSFISFSMFFGLIITVMAFKPIFPDVENFPAEALKFAIDQTLMGGFADVMEVMDWRFSVLDIPDNMAFAILLLFYRLTFAALVFSAVGTWWRKTFSTKKPQLDGMRLSAN